MLEISDLPAVNATLNGTSGVFLLAGYRFIRRGEWTKHRGCMLAAMTTSALFLVSYVVYHLNSGSRPFPGTGPIRLVYFAILITHIILAAVILPMAIVTTARGLASQLPRHRAIARWTFPLWMYVSVTGVVIYLMLYRMY
jgi:putative membrane protein